MFHVDLQGRSDITIHCVHWSTQMPHERNFYLHLGQIYSKCRDIFQTWSIWGIVVIVICFFLGYSILIFNTVAAYLERRFSPQWIDGYSTRMFQESVEWFGMTMLLTKCWKTDSGTLSKGRVFSRFFAKPKELPQPPILHPKMFSRKKKMDACYFQGMTLYDRKNLNSGGFCDRLPSWLGSFNSKSPWSYKYWSDQIAGQMIPSKCGSQHLGFKFGIQMKWLEYCCFLG